MVTSLTARRPGRLPSSYGEVWHWAGADPMPETAHPLKSPNADTASVTAYNHADNATPQRRTFVDPTPTEGDERHLWGQGRPMAKDSSGAGSNWATGTISQPTGLGVPAVESRVMYEGTVTTGLGRATDAREKGRIGIFGTGLSYAGGYGRVTSETLGRDVNPLGRGDGMAYVAGWIDLRVISPALPMALRQFGSGFSINNGCCGGPEGALAEIGPHLGTGDFIKEERCAPHCAYWIAPMHRTQTDWLHYNDCMRCCMHPEMEGCNETNSYLARLKALSHAEGFTWCPGCDFGHAFGLYKKCEDWYAAGNTGRCPWMIYNDGPNFRVPPPDECLKQSGTSCPMMFGCAAYEKDWVMPSSRAFCQLKKAGKAFSECSRLRDHCKSNVKTDLCNWVLGVFGVPSGIDCSLLQGVNTLPDLIADIIERLLEKGLIKGVLEELKGRIDDLLTKGEGAILMFRWECCNNNYNRCIDYASLGGC